MGIAFVDGFETGRQEALSIAKEIFVVPFGVCFASREDEQATTVANKFFDLGDLQSGEGANIGKHEDPRF